MRISSLLNVLIHAGHKSDSDSAHTMENVLFYCHESVVVNYEEERERQRERERDVFPWQTLPSFQKERERESCSMYMGKKTQRTVPIIVNWHNANQVQFQDQFCT